ncbi:MAG: alpha/beta hydrolase [Pseudomonadota bacterium]
MNAMRLSYLDTSFGQLHARSLGQGDPVVLLHLTPGSGAQFDPILPVLAARGYRALALDALGNGRSPRLPEGYSFEMAAQAIGEAIDSAGFDRVRLVGGHMTAQMAVELSVTRPELVQQLVIDGLPMWDRGTRQQIISLFDNTAPAPSEDGAHVLEAWQRTLKLHRAWNPGLALDAAGNRRLTRALIDSLEQGLDITRGASAFLDYDVQPRLARLAQPTLVTTATKDTLHDQHEAILAAIPHACSLEFSGPHPRHVDARAEEYVDALSDFFGKPSA